MNIYLGINLFCKLNVKSLQLYRCPNPIVYCFLLNNSRVSWTTHHLFSYVDIKTICFKYNIEVINNYYTITKI